MMQDDDHQERRHPPINDVQRLLFELLRQAHYNLLNGTQVVDDLLKWRDLWYSVLPFRLPYPSDGNGSPRLSVELALLRTTRGNQWPVDSVYIWTRDDTVEQLHRLIEERWQASDIGVLTPDAQEMTFANLRASYDRVLFVWWD